MVLDGVGRGALLDGAAGAGIRVLALGQLALAAAFGLHRWRGAWTFGGGNPKPAVRNPQVAPLAGRNRPQTPAGGSRRPAEPVFSLRLPGMGAGDVAAGDAGPADAAAAGLASPSAVVVTAPAELPFSQADQDFCQ